MTDREKEIENYLKKKKDRENFITALKGLCLIGSWIIGMICCVLIFVYRIKNPHLTETEIMLYSLSHYWWVLLLVTISTLINNK